LGTDDAFDFANGRFCFAEVLRMIFGANISRLWAILSICGALLAIGAGYERGGISGLRDLALDVLRSVGLYEQAAPGLHAPDVNKASVTLPADEVFWLSIKDSRAPALFGEFLKKFPDSPYAQEARARWEQLKSSPHRSNVDQSQMPMREGVDRRKMMMSPGATKP
jgi:hypothetical protein